MLTLIFAVALLAACTADSASDQTREAPAASGGQVDTAIATESLLEVLPDDEVAEFTDDERYLVNLLASPVGLENDYMVHVVQVDDPNGGAEIGDRWYEPRLRVESCSAVTDQAPMPIAEAGYVPGAPGESSTRKPFAVMGAPHQLGAKIQIFDSSEQRDSFAAVMREFYVEVNNLDCAIADIFASEVEPFSPVDVGYPGYGFRLTNSPGTNGSSFLVQHLVGDRALLTSSLVSVGPSDENESDLDPAILEPFIALQVSRLMANGFG